MVGLYAKNCFPMFLFIGSRNLNDFGIGVGGKNLWEPFCKTLGEIDATYNSQIF